MIDSYNFDNFFDHLKQMQPELLILNDLDSVRLLDEEYQPKYLEIAREFCDKMMEFGLKRQELCSELDSSLKEMQQKESSRMERIVMKLNDYRRRTINLLQQQSEQQNADIDGSESQKLFEFIDLCNKDLLELECQLHDVCLAKEYWVESEQNEIIRLCVIEIIFINFA